jgi:hypothetical protein
LSVLVSLDVGIRLLLLFFAMAVEIRSCPLSDFGYDTISAISALAENVHFFGVCKSLRACSSLKDRVRMAVSQSRRNAGDCLCRAVVTGASVDIVRALLDLVPDYDRIECVTLSFLYAAHVGRDDIVSLLLHGIDMRKDLDTSLINASSRGHVDIVAVLLDTGARVHAKSDLALRFAASHGHDRTVALLLKHHANVHACEDAALRYAADNGHYRTVALLLEHGADVHACWDEALRSADYNGDFRMSRLLIKYGADRGRADCFSYDD